MSLLAPQGFRPEGEMPRRHSTEHARVLLKVLRVEHGQYGRKNLDLLEQWPRGIGR